MLKLTPAENDLLRLWLIDRMRTGGQAISDKALAEELDPDGSLGWNDGGDYSGLSHALFHIATFEVEHGRPVGLVALAISPLEQSLSASKRSNPGIERADPCEISSPNAMITVGR